MTKKRSTKSALISSVLALFLCVSMLVGTTFAWFTDSVSSANNKIVAGNLDIELEYATEFENGTVKTWEPVKNAIDLFDPNALWEPGHVEVVYLKVSNLGSLALKYQLSVNVYNETPGINVEGKEFKLSDYLVFKTVEMNDDLTVYADRDAAAAAAGTELGLKDYNGKTKSLAPKSEDAAVNDEDYVALIVYMPETVGNEANYRGDSIPSIELGVNLVATQMEGEFDSFGDDYDEGANHPGFKVTTANDLQNALNEAKAGDVIELVNNIEVTEPIVIPAAPATYSMRSTPAPIVLDLNGKTLNAAFVEGSTTNHAYAFENHGNLIITGNGTINARGIFNYGNMVLENGTINAIDGNGGYAVRNYAGATFTMNGGTIATTFEDDHKVDKGGYDATTVRVDEGATFVMNGGTINNICDYTFAIDNYGETIVNAGTITSVHSTVSSYGTLTIKGGSFTCNGLEGVTAHAVVAWENSETNIYGGNFDGKDNYNGFNVDAVAGATVNIYGGNFLPVHSGSLYGDGTINVYGGTFFDNPSARIAEGFKAVKVEDVYLIIASDREYIADGVQVSTDGNTYYISNVAGWKWMDAQTDDFFLNKTVAIDADIDFGGATLTSVKFWDGKATVDGQNHTLSNFVIAYSGSKTPSGLFGGTLTVKNLIIDNANVTGDYAGAIAGNMYGDIVNCTVKNSVIKSTYWQAGALVGQYNAGNVTDCTVENCTVSGGSAVGALIGILNESAGERKVEGCTVTNCTVTMNGGFGGAYDDYFGVAVGLINIDNSIVHFNNCTIENNTLKGEKSSDLYGRNSDSTKVFVDGYVMVSTTAQLIDAIKNAPVGSTTTIYLADMTYDGNIDITVAALGKSGGDVVIKAMEGAKPVISGTVTLGYRNQGVGAAMYDANVTFEGVTFNHAESAKHSFDIQDVKSLTLTNCTIIGDGEYGITSARGNAAGTSKIVGCTFENAAMQLLGNLATGLVIDDCTFNNSRVNVQAGNGVTIQNCEFKGTVTDAHVGDSFYFIRSNATPITVKDCEMNVDSTVTGVATNQAKWYLLANRGTTNWTVENVAVTLTDAATAQTSLVVTACTSTGVINTTNLTVNGVVQQ